MTKCETCNERDAVVVCSVPGVPYSAAFCRECLDANAIPYWIAVANTASLGGLDNCAEWWGEAVLDTLRHLGKTREDFDSAVAKAVFDMDNDLAPPQT